MHNSQHSLLLELSYYIFHYSEILPGILEPASVLMRLGKHGPQLLTIHMHVDCLALLFCLVLSCTLRPSPGQGTLCCSCTSKSNKSMKPTTCTGGAAAAQRLGTELVSQVPAGRHKARQGPLQTSLLVSCSPAQCFTQQNTEIRKLHNSNA